MIQEYPLSIDIYKGEGRLLVVCYLTHGSGLGVLSNWSKCFAYDERPQKIGEGILEARTYIVNSPISNENLSDWKFSDDIRYNHTKYKSLLSFWKNNIYTIVRIQEDGTYRVCSMMHSKTVKYNYGKIVKEVDLARDATAEELGRAVLDAFDALEEKMREETFESEHLREVELLDGGTLTIKEPDEEVFEDSQDCSSGEIYQSYTCKNRNGDDIAIIYVGIASEITKGLAPKNIRADWEQRYKEANFFEAKSRKYGIFTKYAEMKNKEIHKKSYFLQMEEDLLLDCSIEIYGKVRKEKEESLLYAFEVFAKNCKL